MKETVAELYANIIRFFVRARDWCMEGTLSHMIHSLTRPAEIRCKDLMEDIQQCSIDVDKLAWACSQAEQRDMHSVVKTLSGGQTRVEGIILEMKRMMISYDAVNAAAALNTNQRLFDVQLSNILSISAQTNFPEPLVTLEKNRVFRNKRSLKHGSPSKGFSMDPKLENWERNTASSLVAVKGSYRLRFEVKDFCVNIVEYLRTAAVPVVWALPTPSENEYSLVYSTMDLLKHLTWQILRINKVLHAEAPMAITCARFQTAMDEDQWFDLLASVVAGMNKIYIVIDVELLSSISAGSKTLPEAFLYLFSRLAARGSKTVMKVVLVSYTPKVFSENVSSRIRDVVVDVGSKAGSAWKRQKRTESRRVSLRAGGNARRNVFG
ncbi:hypothetical protein ONS96_010362 [Cadophora gregata f. sp. sojae]|nr:hypothetical protein ONS96_010362 [Cadophora gregata f. sp. sojae]